MHEKLKQDYGMIPAAAPPAIFVWAGGAFAPTAAAVPLSSVSRPKFHIFAVEFERRKRAHLFSASCSLKNSVQGFFEYLPEWQDFSILIHDIPWDADSTWSTFAAYFFFLHTPLSLGGLSIVAYVLHQSDIDPLTMAYHTILVHESIRRYNREDLVLLLSTLTTSRAKGNWFCLDDLILSLEEHRIPSARDDMKFIV
ncbi:hypothetical protein AXF42_Ash007984 [Apostasia shenzhenica]|uniref:Uncharacterized protein n=1 Tax=Apostasia shenzhenica TaxID=1088818 RepID=A0A2I0A8B4_9ASPA|nr:hypothetical protein AXF42_Ash007984 [Apostasia shenzhenica]